MEDCIFCKIVKGELPSKKVFENDDVIAFENIYPAAETHILVCPKNHIESVLNIDKEFNLFPMYEAAQKIIFEKKLEKGYKLVFNGGKYQSIPHLHWHLLAGELEENGDVIHKT